MPESNAKDIAKLNEKNGFLRLVKRRAQYSDEDSDSDSDSDESY